MAPAADVGRQSDLVNDRRNASLSSLNDGRNHVFSLFPILTVISFRRRARGKSASRSRVQPRRWPPA
jgi:hypothetical protein